MTIIKRGVSSLFAVLIPLVAFAPLAGSAGPILGSAQRAVHQTGTVARQAQSAARPAKFLTGWPVTSYFTSEDLGALVLTPGHSSSSSAETLDVRGNANPDSAFQIGKTHDIASDWTVSMVHRDAGDEGHWGVGSSAPFGTNRLFAEHILAGQGMALDAIARTLCGRGMAPKALAKLNTNAISDDCTAINGERNGPTEFASLVSQNHNLPEPSTGLLLLAVGLIGVGARMKATLRASSESV